MHVILAMDEMDLDELTICLYLQKSIKRDNYVTRSRFVWENFSSYLRNTNHFKRFYRMDEDAYEKLYTLLAPRLTVNAQKSCNRTGKAPVDARIILHCTIRFLAGGNYDDIRMVCGISTPTFYKCVQRCIEAIHDTKTLNIIFPTDRLKLDAEAEKFGRYSRNNVMMGCVGALDGWLCCIKQPSVGETDNVKSFYSGHYSTMGLNVQACCDIDCKFTYVSLECPGGANDLMAFYQSNLPELLKKLPAGKYIVGDNAYVCSNTLLTPYSGKNKQDVDKDAFNFYLSQMRIRIEQAFGLLTNKWRIFRKPLETSLRNTPTLILAAMKLHNFCIDNRGVGDCARAKILTNEELADYRRDYVEYIDDVVRIRAASGRSTVRESILQNIKNRVLRRPLYNVVRNSTR